MFQSVKYEKSCGVIPINQEKILLLHYPSGHWDFPKGHVDPDETEEETALRELKEETGIQSIRFIEGFRHVSQYHYRRQRAIYRKKVVYFMGITDTTHIELSEEHQGYVWLDWDKALATLTFDNSQAILSKARDYWQLINQT